jgi:hypothetical protein
MKKAVMRALTWLALRGRLYAVWSKVYQFFGEHKHIDKQLPPYSSFADVKKIVGKMKWRKDTWFMLWDAVSHPVATYSRHMAGMPAGDCDDQAFFAVRAIEDMRAAQVVDGVVEVGLLSVPWLQLVPGGKGKTRIGGHNVCVFRYYRTKSDMRSKWAHISNWHNGEFVSGFDTLEDVVKNILEDHRISLGWAYWDVDLKLKRYASGKTVGRQS